MPTPMPMRMYTRRVRRMCPYVAVVGWCPGNAKYMPHLCTRCQPSSATVLTLSDTDRHDSGMGVRVSDSANNAQDPRQTFEQSGSSPGQ
eukprot:350266-Chlamydomonas_euryale.AAC.7